MQPSFASGTRPQFSEVHLPERISLPLSMDAEQQAAANALINGPRGAVYGPFRALLHRPNVMSATARLGEVLRFQSSLSDQLREWTICVVARELSNVFEWDMHMPLAQAAGVSNELLTALERGVPLPADTQSDLGLAPTVVQELLHQHRLSEATYAEAIDVWGEAALVELLMLVGYFVSICWLMNVARTPSPIQAAT